MSKAEVTYMLMATAGLILAAGIGYIAGFRAGVRAGRRIGRDEILYSNGWRLVAK